MNQYKIMNEKVYLWFLCLSAVIEDNKEKYSATLRKTNSKYNKRN
jgi:hypothetical protein